VALAYFPYVLIVVVFSLVNILPVKSALDKLTVTSKWPGLSIVSDKGVPSTISAYKFDWISDIGTLLFIIGIITAVVLRIGVKDAVRTCGETLVQLRTAIVTVLSVLALAFVMNASGQTVTLGLFLAQAGGLFALLAPLLGWLDIAVTGSDTSSNSLFGAFQQAPPTGRAQFLAHHRRELLRRRAGQDDLTAEPRGGRRRGGIGRSGGRVVPSRHRMDGGVPDL